MHVLILIHILVLVIEKAFKLEPIIKFSGEFELSYSLLSLLILNLTLVFKFFLYPKQSRLNKNLLLIVAIYSVFFIQIPLFRPDVFTSSLSLFFQFIMHVLIAFLILNMTSQSQVKNLIFGLDYIFIAVCLIVYLAYFFPNLMDDYAEIHGNFKGGVYRVFGVLGDNEPWIFSYFSLFSLIRKKYGLSLFFAGSCILGGSLGASFLLLSSIFLFFWFTIEKKAGLIYKSIAILIPLFILFLIVNPGSMKQLSIVKRIQGEALFDEGSGAQRIYSLGLAYGMISQKFWEGYGYGSYPFELKKKYGSRFSKLQYSGGALSNTTNPIFQMIYEVGFIGFILIIFFAVKIFRRINRHKERIKDPLLYSFVQTSTYWFLGLILFNHTSVWSLPGIWFTLICIWLGILLKLSSDIQPPLKGEVIANV